MTSVNFLGKSLVFIGIILIVIGALLFFAQKFPWLGKLPGDIYIQRKNFSFYFPITTCIALSIIISILLWLFSRR